jgi:hypothetical protein
MGQVLASPRLPSGMSGAFPPDAVSLPFVPSPGKKERYKNKKIAAKKTTAAIPNRTFSV